MQTATVTPEFDLLYYPKGGDGNNPFGTFHVVKKGFDFKSPVYGVVVLLGKGSPTTGDGSLNNLVAMSRWPGIYNATDPNVDCLLTSVVSKNLVLVFVQTTDNSAYRGGEIEYAVQQINAYNLLAKPGIITCSLGGYGFAQMPDTAKLFSRWVSISPGGDGNVGKDFPAAIVAANVECQLFHNSTDPIANVAESIMLWQGIEKSGGKADFIEWDNATGKDGKPIHEVTMPLNAYYPWAAYNTTDHKLTNGSFVPVASIYDFLMSSVIPIPADKHIASMILYDLKLEVTVYQKPDGSYYSALVGA